MLDHESAERALAWVPWAEGPAPTARHELFFALWKLLHDLDLAQRSTAMARLREWAGAAGDDHVRHRVMNRDELLRLAGSALIDVGAHSINHLSLGRLTTLEQQHEAVGSRAWLEGALGRPVTCFSYPYGREPDITPVAAQVVRQAGFSLACAGTAGRVHPASDVLQLPRLHVQDWPPHDFEREIVRWLLPGDSA